LPPKLDDFDYANYLLMRGVGGIVELTEMNCNVLRSGSVVQNAVIDAKNSLIKLVDSGMPEPEAGLLAGILFGQKRVFDKDFEVYVRSAGVAHVVAASGYNIAFVTIGVDKLLFFVRRRKRLVAMIIVAWIYVLLAGMCASIVRAAIMATFAMFAGLLGSKAWVHEAIPVSAFIFCFVSPNVIYDVGFLLSVAATLGLVYIVPVMQRFKLGLVAESMACLVATIPISIVSFGTISVVSILCNLVVVLLLDMTMTIGVIGVLAYIFSEVIGKLVLLISWTQLRIFEVVVRFAGSFAYSVVNIDAGGGKYFVFAILVCIVVAVVVALYPKAENYKFSYYFPDG
jgi:competence protein ComEC